MWIALGLDGQWYPQENGPVEPRGLDWETIVYVAGYPIGSEIKVAVLIADENLNSKLKNYIQEQGEWYEPYGNNSEIEENIKASVTVAFKGHKLPNKILSDFEDNYVDIWFCTKNMTAKNTTERSYSAQYSKNITYTKLPYEEGWQSFGFAFPSSLNLSDYSAISIRVYGACSISALLSTSITDQPYVYLGLRSSTKPNNAWNQLIWDLTASDVDLVNVTGITFVMDDEIGTTRTFFLDDIELTTMVIPQSGLLANFEDNSVDLGFCNSGFSTNNMTAKKTSERSYSAPYSLNITYTKLPREEGWQSFGFAFPNSLNLSDYSAISIRVYGACSISALLSTSITDQSYIYLGLRSSTKPDEWDHLIWDLTATDVDLLNVTDITLVMDDEINTTRTFFLDDLELTTMDVPKSGLLVNFEDTYVDIWFCTKNMTAKKTSEISYSKPYSKKITYTKFPPEEWHGFGFDFPSSLNLSNYSAIFIHVYGLCNVSADLWTNCTPMGIGSRSSTEPDRWNQLIWDLHATDVDLSKINGITFVIEGETGVNRTFFLDDIELTTAAIYVPDDYPTIQDAVNAASDGDTIIVRDGTYIENVEVYKRLTIQSENGCDNCIVQVVNSNYHVFGVSENYVNIRGFTVEGANGTVGSAGIYLGGVSHCHLSNNKASNNDFGIHLDDSSSNLLNNNIANNNNFHGIYLYDSSNNSLTKNIAYDNNFHGVYLHDSSNNSLTTNNAYNNDDTGICLDSSKKNILTKNTVYNNRWNGICLDNSSNNSLMNNIANNTHNGICLDDSGNNTLSNNTLFNNTDSGIWLTNSSNNRLMNNIAKNNLDGIALISSSNNSLIINTVHNNTCSGFYLGDSSNNSLGNNIVYNNTYNGFYLTNSSSNSLMNNIAKNNSDGITLDNSGNNTLSNNTLSNNTDSGIWLKDTSSSNLLMNNNAKNNLDGVALISSSNNSLMNNTVYNNTHNGFYLTNSSSNSLTKNTVYNNIYNGFYLTNSSNNLLMNNNVKNNLNGIVLIYSNNNLIYHNNYIDNDNQSYDEAGTNLWNSSYPIGGNYWDDYLGSDVYSGSDQNVPGSDDFCDTPYGISGDASAQDRYPFMNKDGWSTKPVFGVELSASADALSTAQSKNATYLLTIRNTGTVRDNYTLSVENTDNADVAASSTYYIKNLTAGASETVLLNVTDAMADSYRASVKATSEGDSMKSATIDTTTTVIIVIIVGTRPPSIITISVTPNRTKCGESITISGNIIPATSALITLTFTTPTGSVLEQTTASPSSGTYRLVFPTNKEGIWFVNATWAGDINYLGDTSKTVSFTVNGPPDVGYAVIITGRHDDNRAQSSIDLTANKVYRILSEERGFTNKSIFYMNPLMEHDANDDGVYDVDRISSLRNVSYAINTWAKNNVSVDVPLLLYMVDHGGTDAFLVNGANHTLTASDLNNYLDQLTDATGCHNITVVYDACKAGSFIDDLSRTGRIVVTSTGIDADAFINKIGAHFSLDFFRSISNGKTIKEAFEDASNNLYLKKYFPEITPMLEDNGDKRGHTASLPNAGDGLLAASKYIGIRGSTLNFPPTIIGAIPSQEVVVNTNVTIWAVVVDDSPIEDVYANIIEPNWSPSPVNDTLFEINLTTLQLEDTDVDGNYTARFTPTVLGNYTVILHATDERGNPASPKQRIITAVPPPESAYTAQEHILAPLAHTTKRSRQIEDIRL